MTTGRIDVHSHLLPGLDDGCRTTAESIECAKLMVAAGYTHSFCTPHVWPNLPGNTVAKIPRQVAALQAALDDAGVPLRLFPGGEMNLDANTSTTAVEAIVSYGMRLEFVLIDLWADELPPFFESAVRWLQSHGTQVILAHPERMEAVQSNPDLADYFADVGLLMQGNLQCFSDRPDAPTRRTVERYLLDGRYFMLGSDLHNAHSLPMRLNGLQRAIELVGETAVNQLTIENPRRLLPSP